jgi:cytochrome c oxidase subunit 2
VGYAAARLVRTPSGNSSGVARRVLLLLSAPVLLAGCGSNGQSTLAPHSKASGEIATLWWSMFIGAWVVFGVVLMLLVVAFVRRRGEAGPRDDSRSKRLILIGGGAAPVVVLSLLFAFALRTMPATSAPKGTAALTVEVIGHQWWWEIRYPGTDAVTANELHIPARTDVRVEVRTADVIHSFWVPELNRKIDMIPGRTNSILLRADRVGVYRGQCAEFCGLQHANMAFFVYADPPARFRTWLAHESKPAAANGDGEAAFVGVGCGACHTIRGTSAKGDVGPDLTHVASRTSLAALTIPNRHGDLADWIADPQHIKPGNLMPDLGLERAEVQAVVDYLEGLK